MKLFFLKTWENIDFKRILKVIQIIVFPTRSYDLWQIQFNILPQNSHTFYRTKRNNEILFLLIWLFKILNIAFYGVMGSMANKSTMFSKQSLIRL
ncbi:hypothetical protein EFM88_04870 [Streptococcus thermophilus]|nr:hypothetical protein [Streptococcus thermophilus]